MSYADELERFLRKGQDAQKTVDAEPAKVRCSGCGMPEGSQHKPSCSRQGVVTATSDYRDRAGQIPHCPELNTPGNIGCICLACVRQKARGMKR